MTQRRISTYLVLSSLGRGGMGEVVLAEDPVLKRRVAIKRLHADVIGDRDARDRLLAEARAAAGLDHPNICGVFEVGEDADGPFIVMPYLEGDTLAVRLTHGPLPIGHAVEIAARVADALSAAHAQNLVHRDIKPSNIMIGPRGNVRVMDFGLAKRLARSAADGAELTTAAMTVAGTTLGTAPYFSPEQARAEPVDARSDVFSLGVVLYEMLTGQRPFRGTSFAEVVSAVLTVDPPLPGNVPPELQRILAKSLRKNREERYQSAADLLVDLQDVARHGVPGETSQPAAPAGGVAATSPSVRRRYLGVAALAIAAAVVAVSVSQWRSGHGPTPASAAPVITSVAVLPLASLSADPNQGYFAAGMTEALIAELARIKSLRVISRTSTAQYLGTTKSMPEIARELQVDGIVEGSVLREGDTVRISAQLIHGPTDRHVWANNYEGTMREVLALQRRVASAITSEVRATLAPGESLSDGPARAVDPAAQDNYLRGRKVMAAAQYADTTGERVSLLSQAIQALDEALARQPDWSQAWSALASARHWQVTRETDANALFSASREAAQKAIALDDGNSDGHGALAYVSAAYYHDWDTAEREFQRAVDLNRTSPYDHGFAMMLSALGRHEEARLQFAEALLRDPLNPPLQRNRAWALARARDYDEAIRQSHGKFAEVEGWALLWADRPQEALKTFEEARSDSSEIRAGVIAALARMGRTAEARAKLPVLVRASTSALDFRTLAKVYAALGDRDRTMDTLERAYAAHTEWLAVINVEPSFDTIRSDPRFVDLLRRLGLPR